MSDRLKRAQELVERPSEGLAVEIKRWIDPDQPEGQAKIVRTALSLWNNNGGFLIIGFDNDTLLADNDNTPADVRSLFNIDKIQALIAKYASEPFEIFVDFPEIEGQEHPVLTIPPGVKSPVAAKANLQSGNRTLIAQHDIYIRTLNSNNKPSTSKAGWRDWSKIMDICFENREADIGRFFRRHLNNITPEIVQSLLASLSPNIQVQVTVQERLEKYLTEGSARFQQVASDHKVDLSSHGAWEVVLLLVGDIPSFEAGHEFLDLLRANNPQYTGWPVWLVNTGANDPGKRPYVFNEAWEEFIFDDPTTSPQRFFSARNKILDFMIFDPKGHFYQRRAFQEDMRISPEASTSFTILDFVLPIIRTAETIAVGFSYAKAMGCSPEKTTLSFMFRWTKLRNRELVSWNQSIHFWPKGPARQDEVKSSVKVPLDTPLSAIGEYVYKVTRPLFMIFGGHTFSKEVVEDWTRKVLERKL